MKKKIVSLLLSALMVLQPLAVMAEEVHTVHPESEILMEESLTEEHLAEAHLPEEHLLEEDWIESAADEILTAEDHVAEDFAEEEYAETEILPEVSEDGTGLEEFVIEAIEEVEEAEILFGEEVIETDETEPLTQAVKGTAGTIEYELTTDGILTLTGTGTATSAGWSNYKGYVKEVVIDNGITIIEQETFAGCDALETVTLPADVAYIRYKAFWDCDQLRTVNYEGTYNDWNSLSVAYGNADLRYAYSGTIIASGTTGNISWEIEGNTLFLSGSGSIPAMSTDDGSGNVGAAWCRYDDSIRYIFVGKDITGVSNLLRTENIAINSIYFFGDKPGSLFAKEGLPVISAYYPDANQTWNNEVMEADEEVNWIPYCSLSRADGVNINHELTYGPLQIPVDTLDPEQDPTNFMQSPTETNTAYRMKSCGNCNMHEQEDVDCVHGIDVSKVASDHPYNTETNTSWTFGMEGATEISMTFDEQTNLETNYDDFLYVYDQNGDLFGKYINDELSGKTLYVPGNSVTLTLVTDYSTDKWGFALTEAYGDIHHWDGGTVIKDPYGTSDGEILYTCTICEETKSVIVEARYIVMGTDSYARWGIMKDGTLELTNVASYVSSYGEQTIGGVTVTTAPWGEYYSLIKKLIIKSEQPTTIPDRAFLGMRNLESINFGNNVTHIDNFAFKMCSSLTSIDIPDGVTHIDYEAFAYCSNLKTVTIPWTIERIESSAFYECNKVSTAYLPPLDLWLNVDLEYQHAHPFGAYENTETSRTLYMGGELIKELEVMDSVTVLKQYLFVNCDQIEKVTLGENIRTIEDGVFMGCTNMKLSRDKLPNALTYLGEETFADCKSIEAIAFPSSLISMGGSTFAGCSGMKEIRFAKDITLTTLPSCAFGETGVIEVTLPESVTKIYSNVFEYCKDLKKVTFSDNITEIPPNTFCYCENLEEVNLPAKLKLIDDYAFQHCYSLKEIEFPDNLETIESSAFYYCDFNHVVLPAGLKNLSEYSFSSNWNLNAVTLLGDYPSLHDSSTFALPNDRNMDVYYYTCNDTWNSDEAISYMEDNAYYYDWKPVHMSVSDLSYTDAACTEDGARVFCCDYCKEEITEVIPAFGHNYSLTDSKTPTCGEGGYNTYTCSVCSDTYTDELAIDSYGHCFGTPVVIGPTCSASGYTYKECTICGYNTQYDWTSPLPHDYKISKVEATCSSGGYTHFYCEKCGYNYDDNWTEPLAHNYEVKVIEPTCTAKGYTLYTCRTCMSYMYDTYKAAAGHKYQPVVTEPTCTAEGFTTYICTVCADTYAANWQEPVGHKYEAAVTAPTCTEKGFTTYTCSSCQESYTGNWKAAAGHDYTAVVTPSSCTADGFTTYICGSCQNSYVGDETEKDGHRWNAGTVTKEPTYLAKGVRTYTCIACDVTYQEDVETLPQTALENCTVILAYSEVVYSGTAKTPAVTVKKGTDVVPKNEYTVTYSSNTNAGTAIVTVTAVEGDVAVTGTATATFTIKKRSQIIQAVPTMDTVHIGQTTALNVYGEGMISYHSSDETAAAVDADGMITALKAGTAAITVEAAGTENYLPAQTTVLINVEDHKYTAAVTVPTCTEKGFTTYTCSICQDSYVDNWVKETEHSYEAVVTPTTCVSNGFTTYTCSSCQNTYVGAETVTEGHKWDEGRITTEPTYLANGIRTFSCTACDANYQEDVEALAKTDLKDCTIVLAYTETSYTGTAKTPAVTVKNGEKNVPAAEYKVSYTSNINAGTAAVTVTAEEGNVSVTGTAEINFVINKSSQDLQAAAGKDIIHAGQMTSLTVYGKGTISYRSSDAAIATVDTDGKVTAVKPGTVYITVSAAGTENYLPADAVVELTVEAHKYGTVVTAPTCTERGYMTYSCSICQDSYTGDMIPAAGHSYTAVVTPSSCDEKGFTTYTCSSCQNTYVGDETATEGHRWNAGSMTKEPTYLTMGVRTYTCTACNASYQEDAAALGQTELKDCTVILSYTETTYSGAAKTPSVTVKNGANFVPKSDYKVTYASNLNAGTAAVTVTAVEGDVSVVGTATASFTIKKRSQYMQAVPGTDMVHMGQSTVLNVYGEGAVQYTSSEALIADISAEGVITAHKPGVVTITAETAGTENYLPAKTAVKITVDDHQFTKIDVTEPTYELAGECVYSCMICGQEQREAVPALEKTDLSSCEVVFGYEKLVYSGTAKEMPVTVLNEAVLVNPEEYTVTYANHINAGTATVTITAKEGNVSVCGSVSKTYTIYKREQTVTLALPVDLIHINETIQLQAEGTGSMSYSSSNTAVAEVAEDGTIEAVGAGTVTITVLAAGNENYKPSSAVMELMVDDHNYEETVVLKPATCTETGVMGMKCTICHEDGKHDIQKVSHSWKSWTVSSEATVFAAQKEVRSCSHCKKQETRTTGSKLTPTITLNASKLTLKTGQSTTKVEVTGLANGDSVKSWSSSKSSVVSVNSKTGKITAKKKTGSAVITIKLASGKTADIKVTVQKKAVKASKITMTGSKTVSLAKGKSLNLVDQLKLAVSPITAADKMKFTSSDKKLVTVSSKGVITAKKAGTAKITVKAGSAKTVITVKVPKTATAELTGVPESLELKKGKTYTLRVKTTPSNSDDKITYKSSKKKVVSVSAAGKLKALKKGTSVITVKSGKVKKSFTVTVK